MGKHGEATLDDIVTAPNGDLLIRGRFRGRIRFGGVELRAERDPKRPCGCSDFDCYHVPHAFLLRVDEVGEVRWLRAVAGTRIIASSGPQGSTVVGRHIALRYRESTECDLRAERWRWELEILSRTGRVLWQRTLEQKRVSAVAVLADNRLGVRLAGWDDLSAEFVRYAPEPWREPAR